MRVERVGALAGSGSFVLGQLKFGNEFIAMGRRFGSCVMTCLVAANAPVSWARMASASVNILVAFMMVSDHVLGYGSLSAGGHDRMCACPENGVGQ